MYRLVRYLHCARPCSNTKRLPFALLNLKIGRFQHVALHPNSDNMYVSQVDLGNGTVKQVCSGLRQFIPRDQLQDQLCVVVDNMKKCKLRGEVSEAMILCGEAAGEDGSVSVSLAQPKLDYETDESELIGTQVVIDVHQQNIDKKIKPKHFEDIASRLLTNGDKQCVYTDEDGEKPLFVKLREKEFPVKVERLPAGSKIR